MRVSLVRKLFCLPIRLLLNRLSAEHRTDLPELLVRYRAFRGLMFRTG